MSLPEVLLWQKLRRCAGAMKFRRQYPLEGYVADFYCPSARLIVVIDGENHDGGDRPMRDQRRDAFLTDKGFTVLRITARDVLQDVDAAADRIVRAALPLHQPAAGPPPHASHGEDLPGES